MKKVISCFAFVLFLYTDVIRAQDSWTNLSPATQPPFRVAPGIAQISPDKILLCGGHDWYYGGLYSDTWLYTISTNVWEHRTPSYEYPPGGGPMSGRWVYSMSYIGDDKVLLYGGFDFGFPLNDTWIYDLSDDKWTQMTTGGNPGPRFHHSMAYAGNNKVVLFGGQNSHTNVLDETWVYDLTANTWTQKSVGAVPKPGRRSTANSNSMCNIGGDKVLLYGGDFFDETSAYSYNDTWVYDESADSWTPMTPGGTPPPSGAFSVASLGGDKALLTYGPTYIYDLSENAWTLSPAIPGDSWAGPALAAHSNGKVFLYDGQGSPDSWLFTSASMPWCDEDHEKVFVCHKGTTLCVSLTGMAAHLAHGDELGPCVIASRGIIPAEETIKCFTIYPNPGNGNFIITLDLTDDNIGERTIRVINSSGQMIKQINVNGQNKININVVEAGIYMVQLNSGKQILTKKLVVVR